jgi:hypothetical protein
MLVDNQISILLIVLLIIIVLYFLNNKENFYGDQYCQTNDNSYCYNRCGSHCCRCRYSRC